MLVARLCWVHCQSCMRVRWKWSLWAGTGPQLIICLGHYHEYWADIKLDRNSSQRLLHRFQIYPLGTRVLSLILSLACFMCFGFLMQKIPQVDYKGLNGRCDISGVPTIFIGGGANDPKVLGFWFLLVIFYHACKSMFTKCFHVFFVLVFLTSVFSTDSVSQCCWGTSRGRWTEKFVLFYCWIPTLVQCVRRAKKTKIVYTFFI